VQAAVLAVDPAGAGPDQVGGVVRLVDPDRVGVADLGVLRVGGEDLGQRASRVAQAAQVEHLHAVVGDLRHDEGVVAVDAD
jgi:hypothetical protein